MGQARVCKFTDDWSRSLQVLRRTRRDQLRNSGWLGGSRPRPGLTGSPALEALPLLSREGELELKLQKANQPELPGCAGSCGISQEVDYPNVRKQSTQPLRIQLLSPSQELGGKNATVALYSPVPISQKPTPARSTLWRRKQKEKKLAQLAEDHDWANDPEDNTMGDWQEKWPRVPSDVKPLLLREGKKVLFTPVIRLMHSVGLPDSG